MRLALGGGHVGVNHMMFVAFTILAQEPSPPRLLLPLPSGTAMCRMFRQAANRSCFRNKSFHHRTHAFAHTSQIRGPEDPHPSAVLPGHGDGSSEVPLPDRTTAPCERDSRCAQ